MIELYTKAGGIVRLNSLAELMDSHRDFLYIQFIDFTPADVEWVRAHYPVDLSIMGRAEDIEISSHFHENANQSAFHISLPYFGADNVMTEESLFVILLHDRIISFTGSGLDKFVGETYAFKFNARRDTMDSVAELLKIQLEFVGDYYADLTEHVSKKVKALATRMLLKKDIKDNDLDVITQLRFSNLLIKESMNEFAKVMTLFRKSMREPEIKIRSKIDDELADLSVVSEYIQFNFDRLDDLKENISNKIDLEQNRIVKILTMVTVCIAMPTLIAGIYGMNFQSIPGTAGSYGFGAVLLTMALSMMIPIIFFKIKKWL